MAHYRRQGEKNPDHEIAKRVGETQQWCHEQYGYQPLAEIKGEGQGEQVPATDTSQIGGPHVATTVVTDVGAFLSLLAKRLAPDG